MPLSVGILEEAKGDGGFSVMRYEAIVEKR